MKSLIHEVLSPSSSTIVVDVGCGTGANIAALTDDYACTGIDTSADAIALAQRDHPAVHFIHGYAPADLGPTARAADMFVLMDVIEHVPDDFLLISQIMSAAKPGALFLITVPADMTLWSPHDVAFEHYRRYDPERLLQLWLDLPAQTLLLSHFNTRLLPMVRAIRKLNRLRGATLGSAGTDLAVPTAPVNAALERIFAGEAARLRKVLNHAADPYSDGVSLIAIVRKTGNGIVARTRPTHVLPDTHGPLH